MPRGISRYDEAAFQGRLWTPAVDGRNIDLWFDVADIITISCNASGVTDWKDKSGNNRNLTQGVSSQQPQFSPINFIGKPSITFDGNDKLQNPSAGALNVNNVTFITVIRFRTGSNVDVAIGLGPLGSAFPNQSRVLYNNAGGNLSFGAWANDVTSGFSVDTDGKFNLFSCIQNGTAISFYKNGTADSTLPRTLASSPLAVSTDRINLGDSESNLDGFTGDLAEVLVFYSAQPYSYVSKVEGYLAWKWGLEANLGSTHPFASRPPTIGD